MSRPGSLYFHKSDLEQKLVALIKAAVELAIIRHSLIDEDDLAAAIAQDAANAVRGIDTCAEHPIPEWSTIFAHKPKGRPRSITPAQIADIVQRRNAGEKAASIAADHRLSDSQVYIIHKKNRATGTAVSLDPEDWKEGR
jgi:hypothetical protein